VTDTRIAKPDSGLPLNRSSPWKKMRRCWQLYVIIAIPLAMTILFNYVPMVGLQIAFRQYSARGGIWGSQWVGFRYFITFFTSPSSLRIIGNTIVISLYTIAASFPFAIILAIALNEAFSLRFKKFVQMMTYAPYFISTVVLVSIMQQLLDPQLGIINTVLSSFGIELGSIMGQPSAFRHLYVWSGVWQTTGYSAILYLAALTSVSPELHEAAVVDGCNKFQRIWHVDIPSLVPTIMMLLIINMGYVMSVGFEKVFLMQTPGVLSVSEVMSTYIYRIGLVNFDFSFSTAIGFINSSINLVLMLSFNTLSRVFTKNSLF